MSNIPYPPGYLFSIESIQFLRLISILPFFTRDGYYKPVSSSRRNSRAGSELSISMKKAAMAALAELGEVTDDEDDDDWLAMPVLKEEKSGGLLMNDSNCDQKKEAKKVSILSS